MLSLDVHEKSFTISGPDHLRRTENCSKECYVSHNQQSKKSIIRQSIATQLLERLTGF